MGQGMQLGHSRYIPLGRLKRDSAESDPAAPKLQLKAKKR